MRAPATGAAAISIPVLWRVHPTSPLHYKHRLCSLADARGSRTEENVIIDCDDGFKGHVKLLLDNHVDTVGRYYCTENTYKLIDKTEARQIAKAGIRLFTVYEDTGLLFR
jgi:hypothetical protein